MELLTNWLKGNMGTPGDYSYRPIHWYTIAAIAVITIIAVIWQLQLNGGKKAGKLITTIAWIQLVFEIGWRLIYLLFHHTPWAELWPSYPCNLGGILIPLIALTDWKTGKKMFYLFALVGAILTFSVPDGIFTTDVMVFPIVKSIMQHTGILLIPVLEYIRGTYRPSLRHMGYIISGCAIHAVNSEVIARIVLGLPEDYMFFRGTLPFVIDGVPQFITVSVCALIVLTILSFLGDIRDSVRFLRRK